MVEPGPQMNPTKIRAGLAIIAVIFLGCIVAVVMVDDPFGRWMLGGVALFALVRMALMVRAMRRETATP